MKTLKLRFDSILPKEIPDYTGDLVLTTHDESPRCQKTLFYEDLYNHPPTVIRGIMMQRLSTDSDDLILGIDPGKRTGLSVCYYGKEIESSFYSSVDELVSHVICILGGLRARCKVVKIGDGNMPIANEIASKLNLKFCSSFDLEFVDEKKTSPKIKNFNQRGKRDMLSAKFISQRDGSRQSILPLSISG